MDFLSIIGILIGVTAILGGNLIEGGHWQTLLNAPAALIVLGGTLGAVVLQTPKPLLILALRRSRWIFKPPLANFDKQNKKLIQWAQVARREGLLGLEKLIPKETNPFLKRGLSLVADGFEPVQIRQLLEVDIVNQAQRNKQAAHVFDSMGGYAPTIGIIGAVLGLIHVMSDLQDPSLLGDGIAVAFVATIYGVGLANLLLIPCANKIRNYAQEQSLLQEMFLEGLVSIAEGENPRSVKERIDAYSQAA